MKLFFDTNVILDLILKRELFFDDIDKILAISETDNRIKLYVSSLTIVNANYIACRFASKERVLESLKLLRLVFEILEVSVKEIDHALYSNFNDFEDAVQHYTALKMKCDYIITRDLNDFRNSKIPILSPPEFLNIINQL